MPLGAGKTRSVCLSALAGVILLMSGCSGASVGSDDILPRLAGKVWVAEYILGDPVMDMGHSSMVFSGAGTVSGLGGCNHYSGSFTLEGDMISFGPMAATMMSCSPPLDDLEMRFFQSLSHPLKVKIENGLLNFIADDGRVSVFAAQP
ncbi:MULTISPECIES: META domain-containing protein [unclassified Pseudodesulfovibrio]|uniref:META domain-containing protein n=1 Tax=unclassified Pseudodesulfovibrio TaxID=2661612 RepID=UPI000FEB6A02|nr:MULTISPECIES: META domain-containing protein [unclassified Pseudodesulfovibrio]MCJ2165804.1 META domain-containing protein [Pseudodesulfovibrio sp. S3-i]RWU02761.1 META domain-containing protein [Pseudodesulfovibrio sp. S3]